MASYNPGSGFIQGRGYRKPGHSGADYAAKEGTPIPAAAEGKVIYSGSNSTYGNTVIVEHTGADGTKVYTLYAHMNGEDMPEVGTDVTAGDSIGKVGNTGQNSRGNHLHFEIIDPPGEGTYTPPNPEGGSLNLSQGQYRVNPKSFNNWPSGASSSKMRKVSRNKSD